MATIESDARLEAPAGASQADQEQRFVLSPHRSLPRRGVALVLVLVALAAMLPLLQVQGAALWIIGPFCLSTPVMLAMAFCVNDRAARTHECIVIGERTIQVGRQPRKGDALLAEFNPHWVRVELGSDWQVANRLVLAEGGRRLSVGEFLTPDERSDLAAALRRCLAARRQVVVASTIGRDQKISA